MSPTLLQNLVAWLSAGLGALLAVSLRVSHRQLCALISFAAGTLLATTLFDIIPETLSTLSLFAVISGLASGYLVFYLISRFFFHVCPACAASHFDEQISSAFKSFAVLLLIALGFHCLMDGIALALGRELGEKADESLFLAITVHKFPEGLALATLLIQAGYGRVKSFLAASIIESLTLLGWVLGAFWLKGSEGNGWFYWVLAHVGGGFIYLAFHAVLGEIKKHSLRYVLSFFLLGSAVVILTRFVS